MNKVDAILSIIKVYSKAHPELSFTRILRILGINQINNLGASLSSIGKPFITDNGGGTDEEVMERIRLNLARMAG